MEKQCAKIIACATVIRELSPLFPDSLEYISVEPGLHLHPEKLRNSIQGIIDETGLEADTIILGYGLCSMAAVGLKSSKSTLIIPRVDDCIALFLGSQKLYEHKLKNEPGTYFISKGWIDAGITLIEEFKKIEERLGKRPAEIVKKEMLKMYKRVAYIDMGHKEQDYYRDFAQRAAEKLELEYQEIKGSTELLAQMLKGPRDSRFITASPGQTVSLNDFKK